MTEYSGPLVDHNFTDETWRGLFGDQPGIVNDVTGTAYTLTLATDSNVALVGAADQNSDAVVGGFLHRIPKGEAHEIEVPPSTNATAGRTDVIGIEYDPTQTAEPGPCRLTRLAGVEGSTVAPSYGGAGAFLALHRITRKSGQSLSQAVVRAVGHHRGPELSLREGLSLPNDVPVGTAVHVGTGTWRRIVSPTGGPTWSETGVVRAGTMASGWSGKVLYTRHNGMATLQWVVASTVAGGFTLGAWSTRPIATGLPPASMGNNALVPAITNISENPTFDIVISTSGILNIQARWTTRVFAPGGWVMGSTTYLTGPLVS